MTDFTTDQAVESINVHKRLLADQQDSAYAEMLRTDFSSSEQEQETPGVAQGFENLLSDLEPADVLQGIGGAAASIGSDTLHGIRALFSPAESTSAAILSQMAEGDEGAVGVFGTRMWDAITNQEGVNYAGQVAEKMWPDQGPVARAATEFGLQMVTDPSVVSLAALPMLRKGIRRVAKGKAQAPFTGAVDDLVEAVRPQNADELYSLAKKAEGGDKAAVASLADKLGPYASQWELNSVQKDAYFLRTVGGEGKTASTRAARLTKTANMKRSQGDPQLFAKELDAPLADPNKFNDAYLRINGPDDVLSFAGVYENETATYVANALKHFPENTIQGLQIRGMLKNQRNLLGEALGDVLNAPVTDVQAFAYRRFLSDLGASIKAQTHRSAMKFRSNADRLRFYKLIGAREQVRAELSLTKTEASSLLSKLTTAGESDAIRVVQAERAISKIPEMLNGKEERYLASVISDLTTGDQTTVFLNQVFSPGGKIQNMEKRLHTWWINSVLSGPITHGRNAGVNAANLLLKPVDHLAGGDFRGAQLMAHQMVTGTMDLFRVGSGRIASTPLNYKQYKNMHEMAAHGPQLSSKAYDQLPSWDKAKHFVSSAIQTPSRLMGDADAVFKSLAARQDLRTQAINLATRMTDDVTVQNKLVQKFLRNPMQLQEKQAFINAEKMTFQNPLNQGLTGVHQNAAKWWGTKWLVPFVKTPLNVTQFGIRYTPFAPVLRQVRREILAGGAEGRIAAARMMVIPSASTAMTFYLGDDITGGQNLFTSGANQSPPYSIRFGDKWISYRMFEPLRWTLGPAADLKDLRTAIDWEASDAQTIWSTAIGGIAGAYAKPVMDTVFLDTLADVVKTVYRAAQDNSWSGLLKLGEAYALGMIPNAMTQVNRAMLDGAVHELGGFMSKVKNRVPGLSQSLPPKYGLLGEKQYYGQGAHLSSDASDHRIYPELMRLGQDIPSIPKLINGHELTMVERTMFRYHRANPPGTMSLADAYDEVLDSRYYMGSDNETKIELLQNMTNQYNAIAKNQIMMDNPRLQEPVR